MNVFCWTVLQINKSRTIIIVFSGKNSYFYEVKIINGDHHLLILEKISQK